MATTDASSPSRPEAVSPEKVASVAERIRAFVSVIAANVDEHRTHVDAVNGVLLASDLSGAPPEIVDAVEHLLAANETMRDRLEDSQKQLREQAKQLQSAEQLAETDALTQLANRRAFDKRLEHQHAKGTNEAGVMAILDIDFFKRFNDEHGHRVGDEVLRSVAQMLEARLQPYGLVARFGGEEFCVMIDNTTYPEAIDLIEQTRVAVSNREIRFEGKRLRVTLSVGIGALHSPESTDEWLQRVDDALYRSKEAGRDCAHYIEGERFIRVGAASPSDVAAAEQAVANMVPPPALSEDLSITQIDALTSEIQEQAVEAIGDDAPSFAEPEPVKAEANVDERDGDAQLDKIASSLGSIEPTERPKALAYLPDRETMIDGIMESIASVRGGESMPRLMAVTLSGQPGGATMRSVLQLVRAATRSQDRIGCLNHSTLLVCMPDCEASETTHRAEQICSAAASIGVGLAIPEKNLAGERLSIGIIAMREGHHPDFSAIDYAISQTQAAAMLAARLPTSGASAGFPILTRSIELIEVAI